jgi:flagellar basal-body rod protein FlgF
VIDALTMTQAGMVNDTQRLQVIGNNLANVGTLGFKKDVAVVRPFEAHVADGMVPAVRDALTVPGPELTHVTDFSSGTLKYTGNPLDLGIEGGGFLVVSTPFGEAYTRQGNLQVDEAGRLVTGAGHTVLGTGGEIRLTTSPRIDQNGAVWDGNVQAGQLKFVKVEHPETLEKMGEGLYQASETTDVQPADGMRVRQGYAETANVVAMHEMIKLIETVRHFEASQRLVRGYDDMLDRAINVAGEL